MPIILYLVDVPAPSTILCHDQNIVTPGVTAVEGRAVPAKAFDSVYCVRLAQAAAHAGMAGRTDMVGGRRHNRFVHVPIDIVVSERNEVAPDGDLWLSVLESTAQPLEMR